VKPIIFSTDMVKAILEGRKTQTRRVIEPAKTSATAKYFDPKLNNWPIDQDTGRKLNCPYGQAGDRLWVRETFCYKYDAIKAIPIEREVWYKASNPEVIKIDGDGGQEFRKDGYEASPWLPSIFMPRWASRITLEITEIRVERLQEITPLDCLAEGVMDDLINWKFDFIKLWDKINAKRGYGWSVNPWVWVISFKMLKDKDEGR